MVERTELKPSPASIVELVKKLLTVDAGLSARDRARLLSHFDVAAAGGNGEGWDGYQPERLSTSLEGPVDASLMQKDDALVLISLNGLFHEEEGAHVHDGFASLLLKLTRELGAPEESTQTSAVWRTNGRTIELLAYFDASPSVSVTVSYEP
jgi:hypothetical protein